MNLEKIKSGMKRNLNSGKMPMDSSAMWGIK